MMTTQTNWDPTLTASERWEVIRWYAHQYPNHRSFVETGTADGATCVALYEEFDHLYTIEIVPSVFRHYAEMLATFPKIEPSLGDSTHWLPQLMERVKAPCIFWLDGHFCGSLEARGAKDTPIEEELDAIFASPIGHVILVDDARLFGEDPAYPTLEDIRRRAFNNERPYSFSYIDDIMRLEPR